MPLEIPPSTFAFKIMRKLQELYGKDPGGTEMELSAYPDPWCPDSEIVPALTTLIEEERGTMSTVTIAITDYEDWRMKRASTVARLAAAHMFLLAHAEDDDSNVTLLDADVEMLTGIFQSSIDSLEPILPMRSLSTDGDAQRDVNEALLRITQQRDTLQSQLNSQIASYHHLLGSNAQAVKDLVRLEGRVKELEGELADLNGLKHQVSQLKKQVATQADATSRAYQVVAALVDLQARAEEFASDIGELLSPQEEPQAAPVAVTAPPLLQLGLEDPAEEQSVAAFINQTIAENCMG